MRHGDDHWAQHEWGSLGMCNDVVWTILILHTTELYCSKAVLENNQILNRFRSKKLIHRCVFWVSPLYEVFENQRQLHPYMS